MDAAAVAEVTAALEAGVEQARAERHSTTMRLIRTLGAWK